jgi:hypothetical protein
MPPCRCLSRSLVALEVELVHRWDIPLVNLAVAEVGRVPIQEAVAMRGPWYLGAASADGAQERRGPFDFQSRTRQWATFSSGSVSERPKKSARSNVPDRPRGAMMRLAVQLRPNVEGSEF